MLALRSLLLLSPIMPTTNNITCATSMAFWIADCPATIAFLLFAQFAGVLRRLLYFIIDGVGAFGQCLLPIFELGDGSGEVGGVHGGLHRGRAMASASQDF